MAGQEMNYVDMINNMIEQTQARGIPDRNEPRIRSGKVEVEADCSDERMATYSMVVFTDGGCTGTVNASRGIGTTNGGFGAYIWSANKHPLHNTKIVCRLPPKMVAIRSLNTGRFDIDLVEDHAQRPMAIHSKELLCTTDGCDNIWTYAATLHVTYAATPHEGICSTCRAKLSQDDKKKFTPLKKWEAYTPTNIRAEGLAILTALQAALAKKKSDLRKVCRPHGIGTKSTLHGVLHPKVGMRRMDWDSGTKKILIVTDSLFWIDLITKWLPSWIQKKIVFEKKNSDIVCAIYDQMQTLAGLNIAVEFQHIRGHQDKAIASDQLNLFHKGNILVDKLATHSMTMHDFDMHFC